MLSRIADELGLTPDGGVKVCGPVTWETNDRSADFGFILRQQNRLLIGKSDAVAPAADMWMGANLQQTGKFEVGPATGTVIAVVHRDGGPALSAIWTQDVTLTEESSW